MTEQNLNTSKNIASVLGPVLIAVNISEVIHFDIWTESYPPLVYLNGVILFAVGVALLQFHNHWRRNWTVTITITGWLMLAGGLFRLFFPTMEQASDSPITYALIGGICLLGLIMSWKAYRS